jgi:hypothetical protein
LDRLTKIGAVNPVAGSRTLSQAYQRTSSRKSDRLRIENWSENAPKTHRFCEQSLACSETQLLQIPNLHIYNDVRKTKSKICTIFAPFLPTGLPRPTMLGFKGSRARAASAVPRHESVNPHSGRFEDHTGRVRIADYDGNRTTPGDSEKLHKICTESAQFGSGLRIGLRRKCVQFRRK